MSVNNTNRRIMETSNFNHLEFLDKPIRKPGNFINVTNQNNNSFSIGNEDNNMEPTKTQRRLYNISQNENTFQIGNEDANVEPIRTSKKLFIMKQDENPPYGTDKVVQNQNLQQQQHELIKDLQQQTDNEINKSPFKLQKTNPKKITAASKLGFITPRRNFDLLSNKQQAREALSEITKKLSPNKAKELDTSHFVYTSSSESGIEVYQNNENYPLSYERGLEVPKPSRSESESGYPLLTHSPTRQENYQNQYEVRLDNGFSNRQLKRTSSAPSLNVTEQDEPHYRTLRKQDPVEVHKQSYYKSIQEAEYKQRKQIEEKGDIPKRVLHKLTYESPAPPKYERQVSKDAMKNFYQSNVYITEPQAEKLSSKPIQTNAEISGNYDSKSPSKYPSGSPSMAKAAGLPTQRDGLSGLTPSGLAVQEDIPSPTTPPILAGHHYMPSGTKTAGLPTQNDGPISLNLGYSQQDVVRLSPYNGSLVGESDDTMSQLNKTFDQFATLKINQVNQGISYAQTQPVRLDIGSDRRQISLLILRECKRID